MLREFLDTLPIIFLLPLVVVLFVLSFLIPILIYLLLFNFVSWLFGVVSAGTGSCDPTRRLDQVNTEKESGTPEFGRQPATHPEISAEQEDRETATRKSRFRKLDEDRRDEEKRKRRERAKRNRSARQSEAKKKKIHKEREDYIKQPIPPRITNSMTEFERGIFDGEDRSPLAYVGYKVGKIRGLSLSDRRQRLEVCFRIKTPATISPKYESWGSPASYTRCVAMSSHLRMLADMRRDKPSYKVAVANWDDDREWFQETFRSTAVYYGD